MACSSRPQISASASQTAISRLTEVRRPETQTLRRMRVPSRRSAEAGEPTLRAGFGRLP